MNTIKVNEEEAKIINQCLKNHSIFLENQIKSLIGDIKKHAVDRKSTVDNLIKKIGI